jgi:hypothetical protein
MHADRAREVRPVHDVTTPAAKTATPALTPSSHAAPTGPGSFRPGVWMPRTEVNTATGYTRLRQVTVRATSAMIRFTDLPPFVRGARLSCGLVLVCAGRSALILVRLPVLVGLCGGVGERIGQSSLGDGGRAGRVQEPGGQ